MVGIHEICQCFTDQHNVCNLSIILQYTSISHPHVKIHFLALWVKDSFNSIGCVKDSASAPSFLGLVGGCPGVSSFRSMVHRTRYSLSTGLLTPWSAWWWCGWPSSYCFLSLVWTGHLEENIRICRNEYAETSVTVAHGKVEVDSVVARHKWMECKYKMRGWHEMYAACNRSCIRMRFSRECAGKSSLIMAVASELRLPIYVMSPFGLRWFRDVYGRMDTRHDGKGAWNERGKFAKRGIDMWILF